MCVLNQLYYRYKVLQIHHKSMHHFLLLHFVSLLTSMVQFFPIIISLKISNCLSPFGKGFFGIVLPAFLHFWLLPSIKPEYIDIEKP